MMPLLAASIYWHFPILIIVVSIVYSGTRYDNWSLILNEALRWGLRMFLFLFCISLGLYALSTWI